MSKKSNRFWLSIIALTAISILTLAVWHGVVNAGTRDRFPNQNCSRNMRKLSFALLGYIHDHHDRLMVPDTTGSLTTHSWIKVVTPYLHDSGNQQNSVLYCPDDSDRHKASSYLVPTALYGMTLKEIYQKPDRIIFVDDEPRHTTGNEPLSLKAKDLFRLDTEFAKK